MVSLPQNLIKQLYRKMNVGDNDKSGLSWLPPTENGEDLNSYFPH
jgi:hypothetical protein